MSHVLAPDHVMEALEDDIAWCRDSVQRKLALAEQEHLSLTFLASHAYELAAKLLLAGRADEDECGNMLALAGNAEAFALYLSLFPRGELELDVVLPTLGLISRRSTGPDSTAFPTRWLRAFYLSLVWNEQVVIDGTLMRPYRQVFEASSTQGPAYRILLVEAAQALYTGAPDGPERLLAAFDAMQAPGLDDFNQSYATDISMCEAGMMYRIGIGDEAGFNEEVELALDRHERFYRSNEELRDRPVAWFSLPTLGLCALARDRGLAVSVESPLLPLSLISRRGGH